MAAKSKDLVTYISKVMEAGATSFKIVKAESIMTAPWVRAKCQFGCRHYGKSYLCPPRSPTPEETRRLLDSYNVAILLHQQWTKGVNTIQGFQDFTNAVRDLERELFLDGYHRSLCMVAGYCTLCKECASNNDMPCVFPDRARPSMEACGIDVFQTVRNNGMQIETLRSKDEPRNFYELVLVE